MNILRGSNLLVLALSIGIAAASSHAVAEDIDIFGTASGGAASNPNVLIVLDNRSVWDDNSQQFPGMAAGQAELQAIMSVVGGLNAGINIGLMTYNRSDGGGYLNAAIEPMDSTNKPIFLANVQYIYNNFRNPVFKVSSTFAWDDMLFDAYKYFGGYTSPAHATDNVAGMPTDRLHFGTAVYAQNVDPTVADARAYTNSTFATYNSPLTALNSCAKNYIIFISNPSVTLSQGTPSLLTNVGGDPTVPNPYSITSKGALAPNWARFMRLTDVSAAVGQQNVITHAIDVYGVKPSAEVTAAAQAMAKYGGGKYYTAQSAQQIADALKKIFDEIQAFNSSFAAVALPINAANRTLNDNEVYIGMFRPDALAAPRWFGSVKRYQLVDVGNGPELGDAAGLPAVNPLTGFVAGCATSFWTTDSGSYWANASYAPPPIGTCSTSPLNKYSDSPDGPFVEKGSVAEIIRFGNSPPTVNYVPVWASYRTLYTLSGSGLAALSTTNTGLDATTLDWVLGRDVDNEDNNSPAPAAANQPTRFSVHGDVVHSRPLVVSQKNLSPSRSTIYYGANDGALRAVDTVTGRERWAFYAPEFFTRTDPTSTPTNVFTRLRTDSPQISFPPWAPSDLFQPKDYFFDGSIGVFQNLDNSLVQIFAAQRRGGRMIYALDVSNPDSPTYLWRAGCPNLGNDTGCTSGMSGIGQTWSTPDVAFIKGYSTTTPVVIVGGGYDKCEDADTPTPSCGSAKGRAVYVLDGATGNVLASFATERGVAADIALVDVNYDGFVDYAYVADTGGSLYRIDFVGSPSTVAPLAPNAWTMHYVAYTSGAGRKFLYAPSLLPTGGKVYVAVGSGDREKPLPTNYPYTSPILNRFYVYLDDLSVSPASKAVAVNLDNAASMSNFSAATSCTDAGVLPNSSAQGWYMDLASGTGEQTVTSAVIVGGMVAFSTNRSIPPAAGVCTALGEARGYWLNLLNASGAIGVTGTCGGARSSAFVGGGMPPSPVVTTTMVNGKQVTAVIGAAERAGAASGSIQAQRIPAPVNLKRHPIYWHTNLDN